MMRLVFVGRLLKTGCGAIIEKSRKYTIVTIIATKSVENIIDQVSITRSINQWLKLTDEISVRIQ